MGDKGKKDKSKNEQKKISRINPKEKRKQKKEKKKQMSSSSARLLFSTPFEKNGATGVPA